MRIKVNKIELQSLETLLECSSDLANAFITNIEDYECKLKLKIVQLPNQFKFVSEIDRIVIDLHLRIEDIYCDEDDILWMSENDFKHVNGIWTKNINFTCRGFKNRFERVDECFNEFQDPKVWDLQIDLENKNIVVY